jgi:hypothetical protein
LLGWISAVSKAGERRKIQQELTSEYSAWAEKVADKVSKTSATLVGSAGAQAPEQVLHLQQSVKESQKLLDSNPGGINEK